MFNKKEVKKIEVKMKDEIIEEIHFFINSSWFKMKNEIDII